MTPPLRVAPSRRPAPLPLGHAWKATLSLFPWKPLPDNFTHVKHIIWKLTYQRTKSRHMLGWVRGYTSQCIMTVVIHYLARLRKLSWGFEDADQNSAVQAARSSRKMEPPCRVVEVLMHVSEMP
jgi:hypothetical protein